MKTGRSDLRNGHVMQIQDASGALCSPEDPNGHLTRETCRALNSRLGPPWSTHLHVLHAEHGGIAQGGAVELHDVRVVADSPHDGYLPLHLLQQLLGHSAVELLDSYLRGAPQHRLENLGDRTKCVLCIE